MLWNYYMQSKSKTFYLQWWWYTITYFIVITLYNKQRVWWIKKKVLGKGSQSKRSTTSRDKTLGETTNFQLEKLLKNSKSFLGVFSHDTIPNISNKKKSSGIINLHTSEKEGSHWVCFFNDPKEPFIEYMDSFGAIMSDVIEKKLKLVKPKILYNSSQIQDLKSLNCGYFWQIFLTILRNTYSQPFLLLGLHQYRKT